MDKLHTAGKTLGIIAALSLLTTIGSTVAQGFNNPTITTTKTPIKYLERDSVPKTAENTVTSTVENQDAQGTPENSKEKMGATPEKSKRNTQIIGKNQAGQIYLIQWGDTLAEISAKVGISVDELAKLNHIKDPNWIWAGSALRLN